MVPSTSALAVRVLWGSVRLATQVLDEGGAHRFSVGPGDDDVTARGGRIAFTRVGGAVRVAFTEGLRGELHREGVGARTLSDLVRAEQVQESAEGWALPLAPGDVVRVSVGGLRVEALPVRAPARVPFSLGAWDFRFANTLLAVVLLATLALIRAQLGGDEDFTEPAPLADDALKLRRVLTQAPPPKPVLRAPPEERTAEPAKAKAQSAEAGRPKRTPGAAKDGRAGRPPDVRTLLAGALGPGVGRVFDGGGLGHELGSAMGQVVGAADGLGGWSLRGSGTGGDLGGPLGIGRIGTTRGGPHGAGDPKLGPGKAVDPVGWDSPPPVVCGAGAGGACLDKEMLRRVIRSHLGQVRYCYEQALQGSPQLAGRVAVRFHVGSAGLVDAAEVAQSTVAVPGLGDCLVGRVRTWVFPGVPGGFAVTYPFNFQPAGDGK